MTQYRRKVSEERVIRASRATAIREADVRKVLEADSMIRDAVIEERFNDVRGEYATFAVNPHTDRIIAHIDDFNAEWEEIP